MHRGSSFGFGWANSSGELKALGLNNVLAVDGIHNVLDLLEEVDDGRLAGVDYIEALRALQDVLEARQLWRIPSWRGPG